MTQINEIVSFNSQAALYAGIQLSWYDDPSKTAENNSLVAGYVFGNSVGRQDGGLTETSSLPVFEAIRNSFGNSQESNIFTIIANYGHGKSHFALVLANYFGLPPESPVIADIIQHIRTCSDDSTGDAFRLFKEETSKPHLVVALSGIDFIDLRQGFLRALRKALDAQQSTRGVPIKSIAEKAKAYLRSLNKGEVDRADRFLGEKYQTDLDSLIAALDNFEIGKEAIVQELSRELSKKPEAPDGWEINFGSDVNLKDVINDIVDRFCSGPDSPFRGLLILFDELGFWTEQWCAERTRAGGLAIQSIFEACNDRAGRVCFVGFAQRELNAFVKDFSSEVQTEFKRWAERMPRKSIYLLVSNLEEVISKLLIKKAKFKETISNNIPSLLEESTIARETIIWYDTNWNKDDFFDVITKNCFPLHPMTTGLLCRFEFTSATRSIIQVVESLLKAVGKDNVTENGKPNWIRPVELVGEFKDAFKLKESQDFLDYEYAASEALPTDAEMILFDILKAVFLFREVKMTKRGSYSHADVLARLSGHSLSETEKALDQLRSFEALRFSKEKKEYEFPKKGGTAKTVLDMADRAIVGKKINNFTSTLNLMEAFADLRLPESNAIEFKSDFGVNGDEWCLANHFLDARDLSTAEVKRFCKKTSEERKTRGVAIYLISSNALELAKARDLIPEVISSLKEEGHLFPFVIGVPTEPATRLEKHLLVKNFMLNDMSHPQRLEFADSRRAALERIENEIEDDLNAHFRSVEYVLPGEIALKFGSRKPGLEEIADELFAEAYKFRPPSNTDMMKPNANAGNAATAEIARQLIVNEVHFSGLNAHKQNLIKYVLVDGPKKWGVLDDNYKIREPKDSRVKNAWSLLGNKISKDAWTTFDGLISDLLRPPYGYDDYTLTFLLSAWIGKHKHELGFKDNKVNNGRGQPAIISIPDLQNHLERSRDFVKFLRSNVSVQHSGEAIQVAAKKYLKAIKSATSQNEITVLIGQAPQILKTLAPGDEMILVIKGELRNLEKRFGELSKVEKGLNEIRQDIEKDEDIGYLLEVQSTLKEMGANADLGSNPMYQSTLVLAENRLDRIVENLSRIEMSRIESFEYLKGKLEAARDGAASNQRPDLEQRFSSALNRLNADYSRLQAEANERPLINEINGVKVGGMPLTYILECQERIGVILREKPSPNVETIAKSKQEQLDKQIKILRAFVENLDSRVMNVRELGDAESLKMEIHQRAYLYNETPEGELLSNSLVMLQGQMALLKEKHDLEKAEEEKRRRQEIEKLTVHNISNNFKKISSVEQRFDCLKAILGSNDVLGFSEEQKRELVDLLNRNS